MRPLIFLLASVCFAGGTGSISGKLTYPDTPFPPFKVVATNVSTKEDFVVEVKSRKYSIRNLPPGEYTVIAYARDSVFIVAAGFTEYVQCGMNPECSSHRLIPVRVGESEVPNIDPVDFYSGGTLGVNSEIVAQMTIECSKRRR